MRSDEELMRAGLIKVELWLTPMQTRVVNAVVQAMREHAEQGHMPNEIQALRAVMNLDKKSPT